MQVRAFHTRYSVNAKIIAAKQKMNWCRKYHENAKMPETASLMVILASLNRDNPVRKPSERTYLATDAANEDCASRLVVDVANGVCRLAENHRFHAKAVNNGDPGADLLVHQNLRQ